MTRSCVWSDACLGDTESRGKNCRGGICENGGEGRGISDWCMLKKTNSNFLSHI